MHFHPTSRFLYRHYHAESSFSLYTFHREPTKDLSFYQKHKKLTEMKHPCT